MKLDPNEVLGKLVGFHISYATELCEMFNWEIRIVSLDGVEVPVDDSFNKQRANVEVSDTLITKLRSIG